MPPYLVLLRTGFTLPLALPQARCALTAPFHPYPTGTRPARRYIFCGTGRRLAPPRRYLASCPAEPGLSSIPGNPGTAAAWPTPEPSLGKSGAFGYRRECSGGAIRCRRDGLAALGSTPHGRFLNSLRDPVFYGLIRVFLPELTRPCRLCEPRSSCCRWIRVVMNPGFTG